MKKIIKSFIVVIFIATSPRFIFSQTTFTKITSGAIVNDGGASFGCAWSDYDNDGFADLFVGNMSGAPGERNFLYHNNGDGTFTKIISGVIVNDSGSSYGGCWGDYDNDGKPDLYVANANGMNNFLYHNDGVGNFTRITSGIIVTEGGVSNACSWVDVNNDGNLDMCVTNYGQRRYLYTNNGGGTFTKITAGDFVNDVSPSISSNWGDYDNDGRQDVFVANAGGIAWANFFYKNDGSGSFTKITNQIIAIDTGQSFSGSWGDYDNDGYLDLFVANGGIRNNFLYKNNGDGTFTKILGGVIATEGTYSIGGTWADFNNDGYLDLFVSRWQNLNEYLYFNNGDGTFIKVTTGDIVNDHGNSFGGAAADYDNDGDMDIFVSNINNENNFLYKNNSSSENQNKWINIKCIGTTSNKSAVGARVLVKASINGAAVWQRRDIASQMGYNAQNDLRIHYGLGNATVIDSIKVYWPSGNVNIFANIGVNRFVTITENGSLVAVDGKKTELANDFTLSQNYPNPFNPATKIEYELRTSGNVTLKIYDALGNELYTLVDKKQNSGKYQIDFNAISLASGIYFYKLTAEEFSETRKMILLK